METQIADANPAQEEGEPNLDLDGYEGEDPDLTLIESPGSETAEDEEAFWYPEFDRLDEYYNLPKPHVNDKARTLFVARKKLLESLIHAGADKKEKRQILREYRDKERKVLEPSQREKTAYSSKTRKSRRSKIRRDKEDARWAVSLITQDDVGFMEADHGHIQIGLDVIDPRLLSVFCLSGQKKVRHSDQMEKIERGFYSMIKGADLPFFLRRSLNEAKTKQNGLMDELEDPDLTKERKGEIQAELELVKDAIKSCEEEMRPFISLAYHNRKGVAKQVLNARRKTSGGIIGMSTKVHNKKVRRTQYEDYALRAYSETLEETQDTIETMKRKVSAEHEKLQVHEPRLMRL
jgi:hypothetical protein